MSCDTIGNKRKVEDAPAELLGFMDHIRELAKSANLHGFMAICCVNLEPTMQMAPDMIRLGQTGCDVGCTEHTLQALAQLIVNEKSMPEISLFVELLFTALEKRTANLPKEETSAKEEEAKALFKLLQMPMPGGKPN